MSTVERRKSGRSSVVARPVSGEEKAVAKLIGLKRSSKSVIKDNASTSFIDGIDNSRKREAGASIMDRRDIKMLLKRISTNDKEHTVVLKVKQNCSGDINEVRI